MIKSLRKPCVIANWKMHGSFQRIANFVSAISQANLQVQHGDLEVVLCPPTIYLATLQTTLKAYHLQEQFLLGAQNVYCQSSGAFTGEIAPEMLVDMGCRYVILGHSERRRLFCEDDTLIAQKFRATYDVGIIPILCLGETAAERAGNKTFEVVARQLEAILALVPIAYFARSLIAYEPVWAIGTGLTASPTEAEVVHRFLRDCLGKRDLAVAQKVRIIYGGSVKVENAAALFSMSNIDGALVGAASLVAEDFLKICNEY